MLDLALRKEFRGKLLKGTSIELSNTSRTGATQLPASDFLSITYPTRDVLVAVEAVASEQGRPIVLIGERGLGKSHLMAALYHALDDQAATQTWLKAWADRLNSPRMAALPLRSGMKVISETMHRQRYKFLWDVLFANHPHGTWARGKWEGMSPKTDVPPDSVVLDLLRRQPVALILDEFQTWYDGLRHTPAEPQKAWAFNFVQLLSELAKEHPDLLLLVVSVRNGGTDAFQQLHRVAPVLIDFKGPDAGRDRRRLLLHRLFENRLQVQAADIARTIEPHVAEYLRLEDVPASEHARVRAEFVESWPFAPHLMQLLEDQVLVATDAQETRDLIRILADVFKGHGAEAPILTAADFRLDEDGTGIAALLDSVSNQHHATLREKAQRNLKAVKDALGSGADAAPLSELVGALWLRSLAVGNFAGARPGQLHVDVTRSAPVDDNAFQVNLDNVVENSFNIHKIDDRLVFREEENPQARLLAFARNDKLFADHSDHAQLALEVRYVLGGPEDVAKAFRVIALRDAWRTGPWAQLDESEHPDRWDDRVPLIVLPEEPDRLHERLGTWLREHLSRRRNTVRLLLPRGGTNPLYQDRELVVLARAVLKAKEWKLQSPEYGKLEKKFQGELQGALKKRFDRFAVLDTWNFGQPEKCTFNIEKIDAEGSRIPDAIEKRVREEVFIPEDFEALVLAAAGNNDSVAKLLGELQEPRPNEQPCIAWLGEAVMKDKLLRVCARGKIAIDVCGSELLQQRPGEEEEVAFPRMCRSGLGTGRHLEETRLHLPQAASQIGGPQPVEPLPDGISPGGSTLPPTPPPTPQTAGGSSVFNPPPAPAVRTLHAPATSPMNLLGKMESWGIGPATRIQSAALKIGSLSGSQLTKLIRQLPDGLTCELGVDKEDA